MVSVRVQLQRGLSDTRGTNNFGTASWSACQECLHHSRMVLSAKILLWFPAQLPSIMGYCPSWVTHFPGVSSGVPGFAWSSGDDHSSPFSLRWLLPLSDSAVPVRWLVYSCNTGTVWGPFPYPVDFSFAKEPVGACCYGDSKHLWTSLSLGAAAVSLLK